jgi:MutS family domain IV
VCVCARTSVPPPQHPKHTHHTHLTGHVTPAATATVSAAMQTYLGRVQRSLDCRAVSFTSLHKESHVLEVPEAAAGSMPPEYALVGHRKGYKRYMTPELKRLVAARSAAEEDRERVQAGVLQALERLFVSHAELWSSAVEAVAVLDCIMALAGAATAADGELCRPKLLPPAADGAQTRCTCTLSSAYCHDTFCPSSFCKCGLFAPLP